MEPDASLPRLRIDHPETEPLLRWDRLALMEPPGMQGFLEGPEPGAPTFHWQFGATPDGVEWSLRVELPGPVKIDRAGLRLELRPGYRGWGVQSCRGVTGVPAVPVGATLWEGFPEDDRITVTAPLDRLPPLRIELAKDSLLSWAKLTQGAGGGLRVEILRFRVDRDALLLPAGGYELARGRFGVHPSAPAPLLHPKDLLAQGEVDRLLLVAEDEPGAVLSTIHALQDRLPRVTGSGGSRPPLILVATPDRAAWSELALPEGIELIPRPEGWMASWTQARSLRSSARPALLVVASPSVEQRFGLRLTLLGFLLGARYRTRMDPAGRTCFQRADLPGSALGFLRRGLDRLRWLAVQTAKGDLRKVLSP